MSARPRRDWAGRCTGRGEQTTEPIGRVESIADILRLRVRDWLYGVRNNEPDAANSTEPQTEAERLRVINNMITLPREEGGAGITPKQGEWKNVDSIFPLHDETTNQNWMRDWSQKTFLTRDDLDLIRNKFGEQVRQSNG